MFGLRFLDVLPSWDQPAIASSSQAFILNSWVSSGQMHRVDAFLVPGIFNLPVSWRQRCLSLPWNAGDPKVSLHLLAGSQAPLCWCLHRQASR